ncbi:CvpA family protein [Novosphingopyxis baekryungensis]|uniref:CvpA family protein n=1 Tax=Novosphingopyxis baekryungensis TaxID=279369 RepID=UPI0003B48FA4|nr:CvpA family protein [Novosphingopyxis baekryungensis]
MTAFDIIVLALLGGGAVMGFMRGFVQEVLSLIAWVLIVFAVRFGHAPLTEFLIEPIGTRAGAATLAFVAIVIVIYAGGKAISRSIGSRMRKSVLGPVDRVLGFGFGAVKGLILAALLFLFLLFLFETMMGEGAARPEWLTDSRTYPLMNATGEALSEFLPRPDESADAEESAA